MTQQAESFGMSMRLTLDVLNRMTQAGVIARYAIGGAVAAFYYVEASTTDDLDVLVSFEAFATPGKSGLVTIAPIAAYLQTQGYADWRKEGLLIEGWPVQFLPVSDDLSAEALERAVEVRLDFTPGDAETPTRILAAEHVVAMALSLGRPKDLNRVLQFAQEQAFDAGALRDVLVRHRLMDKWAQFCDRFGIRNDCA
jgi:hypothetical protein